MTGPSPEIEFWPVVESFLDIRPAWPAMMDPAPWFIRLDDSASELHVGTVVATLLVEPETCATRAEAVARSLSDDRVVSDLAGGILIARGDAELVTPGCCADLRDRHGWRDFLETGTSPWTGHDPATTFARVADRICIANEGDPSAARSVELTYHEYVAALDRVELRLCGFARRLEAWAGGAGPSLGEWFVDRFEVRAP